MRPAMPSRHSACRFLLLLFAVLGLTAGLWAQKDTGTIAGTVTDPSGAVVAGARVVITNVDRGGTFTTTTGDSGEYVASPLMVGHYTIAVEHSGFKRAVSAPVSLDVQQRAVVNIRLQLGQASQTVEVTGAAPLLETQTSELGQVVGSRQVENLPLNGRNFAQLALLTAGTAPSEPGARDEQSYGFSAGGARSLQNNFLLDGVDNNSNLPDLLNETNYVIQPPVDALQEFKVQTNAYSAEFGRGNGAIVNAVLKSGTNDLHGSAWGFLRNNVLDARNFFDPVGPTPPYQQYQFGGTFGGPVYIPHVYDGRNKTFFFVDYEGLRIHQADTQTLLVPTADQLAGNFSSMLDPSTVTGADCNGNPTYAGELFDTRLTQLSPSSPHGLCGIPIGGYTASGLPTNIIPAGKIDPLAARLAALFPAPNVSGNPAFNFIANPVENTHRSNFDTRIDQKFSDKNNAFIRISYEDQPRIIPSPFQNTFADGGGFFSGVEDNSYRSVALSDTHVFRPTLINEFRFGYNRINSHRLQFNFNTDVSGILGFPGVPFTPINGGLPQLTFNEDGSAPTLGSPTFLPSVELQNTYVLDDNLTWVHGHHTVKYGTEIRREEFTIFQPAESRGTEDFGPTLTDNPSNPTTGGLGLASFLVGLSGGGGINNLHNVDYHRPIYAFYTQDDWRLTQKLTLNLGLRYELFTTVKERFNEQGTFDLTDPNNPTIIVPKGQTMQLTPMLASQIRVSPTGSTGLVPVDTNNFAPRIGFAYQFTPSTVLRGGYGIFYGGQENGPYSNPSPGFNPPFFVTQSFNAPCGAASANPALFASGNDCAVPGISNLPGGLPGSAGISVGFPATSLTDPNTPTLFSVDPRLVTPYMQQWNFGLERELGGNTMLQITYAGSRGNKLFTFYNGNQDAPSPDPNAATAPRRPVPSIDTGINLLASDGGSKYNSLQTRVEKRFSHGFSMLASYTYSNSEDNASNANLGSQNNDGFRWFMFPQWEWGHSSFDVRHRFTLSYIYQLPFGHGKRFLSGASGAEEQILGGWQVAGITTISSGNWFTPTDSGSFANSDGLQMPNVVSNPNGSSHCLPGTFFNTCAFTDPPLGSFGNAARNSVLGPGFQTWDASIFKTFQLTERARLEFRSEFFNFPNHTNFLLSKSGPQESNNSTVFGAPQFGFLTAARPPRQIQFAMKVMF